MACGAGEGTGAGRETPLAISLHFEPEVGTGFVLDSTLGLVVAIIIKIEVK